MENCGVLDKNTDISINKDDWLGGTFLHAFNLNPDKCGNYHHHPAKGGSLNLILKLASSLTTSHKVIVYGRTGILSKLIRITMSYIKI